MVDFDEEMGKEHNTDSVRVIGMALDRELQTQRRLLRITTAFGLSKSEHFKDDAKNTKAVFPCRFESLGKVKTGIVKQIIEYINGKIKARGSDTLIIRLTGELCKMSFLDHRDYIYTPIGR